VKYKEAGGIYVNKRCVVDGPPLKEEDVRKAFKEALKSIKS